MQLKHALLPVAVLAGSGIFLAKRQFAAAEKRQHMVIYRETIRSVTEHRAQAQAAAAKAAEKKPAPAETVTRESIDLKELAKAMASMRNGGFPDMKAMVKIQKAILALSPEDLSGLITDASAMDLPEEQKSGLLMMLIQGLAQRDPKAAVLAGQAIAQGTSGNQRMMLNMSAIRPAFADWAKKDPMAAMGWYDAEVAAGHFENKGLDEVNQDQTQFEGSILPGLAEKDPAAARTRLMSMSEAQRISVLSASQNFASGSGQQKAFAALVRGTLPAERQAEVLANVAASIQNGNDMKGVSEFIASVSATPEEKLKILPQVAGSRLRNMAWGFNGDLTYESAEPLRKWMEQQQPGSSGKGMGESLAAVVGTGKFDQGTAISLVEKMYDETPSDELITSFVNRSRAQENPHLYRRLAGKIQDPAQRQKTLDLLVEKKP